MDEGNPSTKLVRGKTLNNGNPISVEHQFGQPNGNPRHNGAWKKEDTARYKLERMMELTEDELLAIATDPKAPYFERKLAKCINAGQWNEIQGMLNQVYGYPKQAIETTEIEPPVPLSPRKRKADK